MAKMKAIVKTTKAPGCVELREVDVPSVGPDEVLIKVHAAGVCGTDIGIFTDKPGQVYYPPVVLGHEFSGTLQKIGANVAGWKTDEPVVAEPQTLACGLCAYCRSGEIGMCPHKRSPGWGTDGGMAEYVRMPANLLHRIPQGADLKTAALAEPLAVAVHAMTENTSIDPGSVVVVMGAGPIGILAALVAKHCGCTCVVVGTSSDESYRLPAAQEMGIPVALNVDREDPRPIVAELTDGRGADMVVDACGAESAINLGVELLRKKGRFVATGISPGPVALNWNLAVTKNLSCFFQYSSTYTSWARSLRLLMNRQVPFAKVISKTYPLEQWQTAFEEFQAGKVIKPLLCP